MKIVTRKSLKLDLPIVLGFIYGYPGVPSSVLLEEMQQVFGCKRRSAQDAVHILIAGGWLERRDDKDDARRKNYFVTTKGAHDLEEWRGWREMRLARWQYSSTSTRTRRRPSRGGSLPIRFRSSLTPMSSNESRISAASS